jgi:hypothetical protein
MARVAPSLQSLVRTIGPDPNGWRWVYLASLLVWALYFHLVGLETALVNVALARSGEFEGFGEGVRWLFLKSIAYACSLSACALPVLLHKKYRDPFAVFLYVVLAAVAYLNSYSRGDVLNLLMVPVLVYVLMLRSLRLTLAVLGVFTAIAVPVLLYTKSLGSAIPSLLMTGSGELPDLEPFQGSDSVVETYLRNIEFTWFSVAAGVSHFFETGAPFVPRDIPLSLLFGVIPSGVLNTLGLQELSYVTGPDRLFCVNAGQFSRDFGCTIPPLWSGYSAYVLPVAGGAVFGFARYYAHGYLQALWRAVKRRDLYSLWAVFLLSLLTSNLMSLVPMSIAQTVFVGLFFVVVLALRTLSKRRAGMTQPRLQRPN